MKNRLKTLWAKASTYVLSGLAGLLLLVLLAQALSLALYILLFASGAAFVGYLLIKDLKCFKNS